jgi:hypothetical protein
MFKVFHTNGGLKLFGNPDHIVNVTSKEI